MPEFLTQWKSPQQSLRQIMHTTTCPACGYGIAVNFYNGGKQPLTTLAWPQSAHEATSMEKLPLSFVRCTDCGHVYNRDFTYNKVPYSDKPNLMYNQGALWKEYLHTTQQVILERLPQNPTVVEIGAGDGHFIKAIARQHGSGRYVAFDPNGSLDTEAGLVEFYPELFEPDRHMAAFKPDLIICRHMLEHLENPLRFIQALSFAAEWEGLNTHVFIEVPCIDRVFETGRTIDFFYEHNSHFTTQSLERMLICSHAKVELLDRGYEDEVVFGYAQLGHRQTQKQLAQAATSFYQQAQVIDERMRKQLHQLAQSKKTVAFWGGTGKAATFINRYQADAQRFPLVIDSDTDKAGTYVPGTGQKINTPAYLLAHPVDIIIIATQWRAQDIALEIAQTGIHYQQLLLEYQGKLIDFHTDAHPYRTQGEPLPTPSWRSISAC